MRQILDFFDVIVTRGGVASVIIDQGSKLYFDGGKPQFSTKIHCRIMVGCAYSYNHQPWTTSEHIMSISHETKPFTILWVMSVYSGFVPTSYWWPKWLWCRLLVVSHPFRIFILISRLNMKIFEYMSRPINSGTLSCKKMRWI